MSIQYRQLQQMTKILCNNCSSKWLHWQLKLKSWPNNSEQRATVKVAHDRQGVRHRNKRHSCVITTRDSATKHISARHPVVHKQKQFREMNKTAVNRSHQWSWGISSAPCYRQSNNFSRWYRRGHLFYHRWKSRKQSYRLSVRCQQLTDQDVWTKNTHARPWNTQNHVQFTWLIFHVWL